MSERDLLLRGILENPADDTARLVYADKLDELGGAANAARAEFIRIQVARAGDASFTDVTRDEALLRKWGAKWLPKTGRRASRFSYRVKGPRIITEDADSVVYEFDRGFVSRVAVSVNIAIPLACSLFARQLFAANPIENIVFSLENRQPQIAFQPLRVFPGNGLGLKPAWWLRWFASDSAPVHSCGPYETRATLAAALPDLLLGVFANTEFIPDPVDIPF